MSSYQHIPTNVNIPLSTSLPTYLPVPIPKYQYIIVADPGAGIGLVYSSGLKRRHEGIFYYKMSSGDVIAMKELDRK